MVLNRFFAVTLVLCLFYVGFPVCNSGYLLISLEIMYLQTLFFKKLRSSMHFGIFDSARLATKASVTMLDDGLITVRMDLLLHPTAGERHTNCFPAHISPLEFIFSVGTHTLRAFSHCEKSATGLGGSALTPHSLYLNAIIFSREPTWLLAWARQH